MKIFKYIPLIGIFFILSCETTPESLQIEETTAVEMQTQSVVFIAGKDVDDNTFYNNASNYFKKQNLPIVEDAFSLEGIINWLNLHADDKHYDEIHIVTHSNAWRGLSLTASQNGSRITEDSLEAILEHSDLPKANRGIDENTKIIFHSCGLGANKKLLQSLKQAFSSEHSPMVYASEHFNIFGGQFAEHYLARPFYVFFPTGHSPGPKALAEEIAHRYQSAQFDWQSALETRHETEMGAVYSYRFNIPVEWELGFENAYDIPNLENADPIMDFILMNDALSLELYELGIPLEKFRWSSSLEEKTLTIKGKTTVLCVLQPVMDNYLPPKYSVPDIEHPRLYTKL